MNVEQFKEKISKTTVLFIIILGIAIYLRMINIVGNNHVVNRLRELFTIRNVDDDLDDVDHDGNPTYIISCFPAISPDGR